MVHKARLPLFNWMIKARLKPMNALLYSLAGAVSLVLPILSAADVAPPATRIVLVGDSTVASRTGWGDSFANTLTPGVECLNMGRGGRSSKSYRDEGHWGKVIEAKPTWIFIQFGHNDQPGKGPTRETDARTSFRDKLSRQAFSLRERSPCCRRQARARDIADTP